MSPTVTHKNVPFLKIVDVIDGDKDLVVIGPDNADEYLRGDDPEGWLGESEVTNIREGVVFQLESDVEPVSDNSFRVGTVTSYYPTPESVDNTIAAGLHALAVKKFIMTNGPKAVAKRNLDGFLRTYPTLKSVIDTAIAEGVLTRND